MERTCPATGKDCAATCKSGPCFIEEKANEVSDEVFTLVEKRAIEILKQDRERINLEPRTDIWHNLVKEIRRKISAFPRS